MPNQTDYNNKATSNVVYFTGSTSTQPGTVTDNCHFISVVPNAQSLAFVQPSDFDIAFITNCTDGGWTLAWAAACGTAHRR